MNLGPDVETRIPFDLIVYENAVQFHMERCLTVEDAFSNSEIDARKLGKDLT